MLKMGDVASSDRYSSLLRKWSLAPVSMMAGLGILWISAWSVARSGGSGGWWFSAWSIAGSGGSGCLGIFAWSGAGSLGSGFLGISAWSVAGTGVGCILWVVAWGVARRGGEGATWGILFLLKWILFAQILALVNKYPTFSSPVPLDQASPRWPMPRSGLARVASSLCSAFFCVHVGLLWVVLYPHDQQ